MRRWAVLTGVVLVLLACCASADSLLDEADSLLLRIRNTLYGPQPVAKTQQYMPDPYIPAAAHRHRADLVRAVSSVWGIEGCVACMAGQVHQESRWNPRAKSHVGAAGLTQFMPATARWIAGEYPDRLQGFNPYDPKQALLAMSIYNKHLYDRARGRTECDRWWFTLRAYNGGEGHLRREAARSADRLDRRAVDAQCGTASRSRKHCRENLGYPRKILMEHQPHYLEWGRGVNCR